VCMQILCMGHCCRATLHKRHGSSCAHVAQEKRSPLEQQPSSGRRLTRGHSMPLLSAIHHLRGSHCLSQQGHQTWHK
jgi:hypothetical protein